MLYHWIRAFFISSFFLFFSACTELCEEEYIERKSIKVSFNELRKEKPQWNDPRSVEFPGKIYVYQNYLLLNEIGKGIHVFDNRLPTDPQKLGFLSMRGNFDMLVTQGVLYMDSYRDLLAVDFSQMIQKKVVVLSRTKNTFIEDYFPDQTWIPWNEDSLVVGWTESKRKRKVACFSVYDESLAATNVVTTGTGGSLARFAVSDNTLYAVTRYSLNTIDIENPSKPKLGKSIDLGWGIETLFAYDEKLFIGSNTGMFIYDIQNPFYPKYVSSYSHVTSCDPVVVQGDVAYVTLRSGDGCWNGVNQLEIIDLSDIRNPVNMAIYPMFQPHGLGVDDSLLFVCDGSAGLKIFDIVERDSIKLKEHYQDIIAKDVIPLDDRLILIGDDGLRQYDYSDPQNILLQSEVLFK